MWVAWPFNVVETVKMSRQCFKFCLYPVRAYVLYYPTRINQNLPRIGILHWNYGAYIVFFVFKKRWANWEAKKNPWVQVHVRIKLSFAVSLTDISKTPKHLLQQLLNFLFVTWPFNIVKTVKMSKQRFKFVLRWTPLGNWVILSFSGQKSCTRII